MPLSKNQSAPTQDFVSIDEIRDGIVVLKDGGLRSIVLATSVNFALKSEEEQGAIVGGFQSFLNSLDFGIQIFIQSRRLDIRPYLALLEERYSAQTTDLMKVQTREYIDFVRGFTDSQNIMKKGFFVVVPYTPPFLNTKQGFMGGLLKSKSKSTKEEDKKKSFEENRTQLEQRVAVVAGGLSGCGVQSAPLGTEEVIELFYKIFNPGEAEKPITMDQQQIAS